MKNEHFLYELRGPRGVYIGLSKEPAMRWAHHRCEMRAGSTATHRRMRNDGAPTEYVGRVLSRGHSFDAGRIAEAQAIRAAVAAGENVYNEVWAGPLKPGLPEFLVRRREALGLSRTALAQRVGGGIGDAIGLWERGKCRPSGGLAALARGLRVPLADLTRAYETGR